jgi:hypothetical protein
MELEDKKEQRPRASNVDLDKFIPIQLSEKARSNTKKMVTEFRKHARDYQWHDERYRRQADHMFSNFQPILQPTKNSGVIFKFIEEIDEWKQDHLQYFIDWISSGPYCALLTNPEPSGNHIGEFTPLLSAIQNGENDFVAALLEVDRISVDTLFKAKGFGTCLHLAIEKESPHINSMIDKCKESPDLFLEPGVGQNNILHLLTATGNDELLISDLELAVGLRKETDSADAGPAAGKTKSNKLQFRQRMLEKVMESLHVLGADPFQRPNEKGLTPYQLRVSTLKASHEVEEVLKKFTDPKRSLSIRERRIGMDKLSEEAIRNIINADPIADLIRRFCICNFKSSHGCSKALYAPGTGEQRAPPRPPLSFTSQLLFQNLRLMLLTRENLQSATSSSTLRGFRERPYPKTSSTHWPVTYTSRLFCDMWLYRN